MDYFETEQQQSILIHIEIIKCTLFICLDFQKLKEEDYEREIREWIEDYLEYDLAKTIIYNYGVVEAIVKYELEKEKLDFKNDELFIYQKLAFHLLNETFFSNYNYNRFLTEITTFKENRPASTASMVLELKTKKKVLDFLYDD